MTNKAGDLRVWWIPQVPMNPFYVPVASVAEGVKIMNVLADYDAFQFENKVKPDYCNTGGLEVFEKNFDGDGNDDWCSWYDDETDEDDPREWLAQQRESSDDA